MRGLALFLGGLLLGSAAQTGIAQGEGPRTGINNAIISNAFSPGGVRMELTELGPESLARQAMDSWDSWTQ